MSEIVLQGVPVGFNDLKHHVVLEVLNQVQHALAQGEGCCVPTGGVEGEPLRLLVNQPDAGMDVNERR